MSLRRPEPRHFPLSLGVLAGLGGYLATPGLWPTDPVLSLGLGACVCVVAWAAVEQKPDALDRAVESRAYLLVGGLVLLPAAAAFAPALSGGPRPDDGASLRILVFAFAALVVTTLGTDHRAMLLLEREQVRTRVTAVESRRHEFALRICSIVVVIPLLSFVMDGSVSTGSVIGTLIAVVVMNAFDSPNEYELVALDDHLLLHQGEKVGGTAAPWRRLRDVTIEDDTLRVARGLPYPTVYTADLSEVEDRHAVREAFRSYPYLH